MAAITKAGTPSLATMMPPQSCRPHTGSIAGEDIEAGDACFLHSDGRWYRTDAETDGPSAKYRGVAATASSTGEAVTIYSGVAFHYGSGLTPGAPVFLSPDVPGGLDTANAEVNRAVGHCLDASRIYFGLPQS